MVWWFDGFDGLFFVVCVFGFFGGEVSCVLSYEYGFDDVFYLVAFLLGGCVSDNFHIIPPY